MDEELAVLDDELNRLIKDVQKEYAEVTKPNTKLKRNQRENKVEDMLEKLGTGRNTYSLYLSQLKELMKEADRKTYTEFKEKGHHHHKSLNDLLQNVKLAKQNIAKEERLPGEKDKKDINTWGADDIVEEGRRVQKASGESLARSQKLVEQAEEIAKETNIQLHEQTDQMKEINSEVEGVGENLNRADKIVAHIARRLATDKMIMCLVLLLVLAILALVICKGLGVLPGDGGGDQAQIDCSLVLTQTNSECIAQREAESGGTRRVLGPEPRALGPRGAALRSDRSLHAPSQHQQQQQQDHEGARPDQSAGPEGGRGRGARRRLQGSAALGEQSAWAEGAARSQRWLRQARAEARRGRPAMRGAWWQGWAA